MQGRRPRRVPAPRHVTDLIDQTVGMVPTAGGLAVGGDAERALAGIPVPSYVLDTAGVVQWINPAAERLLGDVRGRHFTSVVGPRGPGAGEGALRPQGARHDRGDRDKRGLRLDRPEPASRWRSAPCR